MDPAFANFRKSLHARMKELTSSSVGIHVKKKGSCVTEDEQLFWDSDVFNMDTAEGMSNAVFFYNCKAFGFQGLEEHSFFEAEQFSIPTDPETKLRYILYERRSMKNMRSGLNHRKVPPKTVKHFGNTDNDRYLVRLYYQCLSYIPRKGDFTFGFN